MNIKDPISKNDYLESWKNIATTNDMCSVLNNVHPNLRNAYNIEQKFKIYNIHLIHKGENEQQSKLSLF